MTNKPSYGQVRPDSGTPEERYAQTAQHQDRENRQTLHSSALSWSIPLRHLQLPRPRVGAFVFSALEGDHGTVLVGHMTILVGTASRTDKSLIESGKFYPPSAKDAETRLRYYASQFPMVEVDSSYYAIPLPATTQQWAERTPDDFVFNIKAFRLFTGHQAQPRAFPKDIQESLGLPLSQKVYYRDSSRGGPEGV